MNIEKIAIALEKSDIAYEMIVDHSPDSAEIHLRNKIIDITRLVKNLDDYSIFIDFYDNTLIVKHGVN